jgi:hypothetical protein
MAALEGYSILERLKYWRKNGMWANTLWAFLSVVPSYPDTVRTAINSFGDLDIGVNLPNAWRDADIWDTGSGRLYRPNSWGPHSVPLVGYDRQHVFAVSWGTVIPLTWAALTTFCDEAYALIDPDWIAGDSLTPSHFDLSQLHADLQTIAAT